MKNKILIVSLLSISILSCFGITKIISANINKSSPITESEGVTWNAEKGEYYNSRSFTWDSNKKCYIPILKYSNEKIAPQINVPEEQNQWLLKNKDSSDNIDKVIIQFKKNVDKEISTNPGLLASSKAMDVSDIAYNSFLSLSVNDLTEVLNRISNSDIWSNELENGIVKITKIDDSELYAKIDDSELGINKNLIWVKRFYKKINKVESKIKDSSEKLKNNVDSQTQSQIDNDIQSCGIFAVPYLLEEINNGNDKMMKYLPSLLDNYSNTSKEDLAKKDKIYWQNWFQSHKNDNDALKKLTKAN